ncbi:MAG TPA: UDP-N-acetylglucosamine 2-epimerase [Terriglobia bacterium]|nr:UDP-N-acetylglucosamine 2-epimerase [Terriglobia bacterium]
MTIRTAIRVSALRRSEYQQTVVKKGASIGANATSAGSPVDRAGRLPGFSLSDKNARGVISDSGGVQAETTHLNLPCLTLRKEMEQPVTVDLGTNTLVHFDFEEVLR